MPAGDYRLSPDESHRDYLILSDLVTWLKDVLPMSEGPVFDFGCCDSPYRQLFGHREYHRADLPGTPDIDFEIREDETTAAEGGRYGTILSTQVLEHVNLYREYIGEAHRLLYSGGRMFLTTHGMFEEHGHPHDFRRWTLMALQADIAQAGFEIERADKLTLGPRALHYLIGAQYWKMNVSRKSVSGMLVSLLRSFIAKHPGKWNRFGDKHFANRRFDPDSEGNESLFIGVAVVAKKR